MATLTSSLVKDLEAMDFEEVPVDEAATCLGTRDFQHNGVLVRFWGMGTPEAAWSHIDFEPIPADVQGACTDTMFEVVKRSGLGLARLAIYLHGAK
jgi:hypothetical protein